ncbi:MAG TPA: hypothetical protein VFW87_16880, partial [Pirellulales bacterium]|nr:hypothetical protein [Pirellulales bacterium]
MTDFRKISEDARKEREGEKERQADIDDRSFTAAQTLAEGIVDRLVKQFASSQDWNYEVDSRTTTQKVVIKCAGVDADDDDVELDVCIRPTEGRLLCKVSLALLDDDGTDNRWLHNGQEGS